MVISIIIHTDCVLFSWIFTSEPQKWLLSIILPKVCYFKFLLIQFKGKKAEGLISVQFVKSHWEIWLCKQNLIWRDFETEGRV